MRRKDVMGQFKRMVTNEMDHTNCSMNKALDAINALLDNDKVIKRWNKSCVAHSEQMNATAHGHKLIKKHGDPIDELNNLPETFRKWG